MFLYKKRDAPTGKMEDGSPAQAPPFRHRLMESLRPKNVGRRIRQGIISAEKITVGKFGVKGGFWIANTFTVANLGLEAANLGFAASAVAYSSGAFSRGTDARIDYFSSVSAPALNAVSWIINLFLPAAERVTLSPSSKQVALFVLCTIWSKLALKAGVWVEFAQAMMVDTLAQMSSGKDGFFLRNSRSAYMRESVREQVIDGVLFLVPLPVELLRRPWAIRSKLKQNRAIFAMRKKFGEPLKEEAAG